MFTKQQLAQWESLGFKFDDFYHTQAVEEVKKEVKLLTIIYKSSSIDDKNIYLTFEITTSVLKNTTGTILIQETNATDEIAVNTKVKLLSNQKQQLKVSFDRKKQFDKYFWQDGFVYQATLTCDGFSAQTDEFSLKFKKEESKGCNLKEPKIIEEKDRNFTELQKAKLIATVFGESDGDVNLMINIPWIYFNLIRILGFEKGMNRSSFYKNPNNNKYISESYRISMYYLGQGSEFENYEIVNGTKVKDFCLNTNPSFLKSYKFGLDLIKTFFETYIFISKVENPLFNWEGQGYWGDMDIRDSRKKWAMASQYFHLQNKCKVQNVLVKEIIAYNNRGQDVTTYLCDDKTIEIYFKNNPDDLPEYTFNDFNTIPRVHIPVNKSLNK